MGAAEIIAVISSLLAIAVAVTSLMSFMRNRRKDDQKEGERTGVLSSKLEDLAEGVRKIEAKVDSIDKRQYQIVQDIARIDASNKSLHRRLGKGEDK